MKELFSDLTALLNSFKNTAELENFLEELLTKEEKIMLSKRIAAFSMLYSHSPQRYIQQHLGMSDEGIRIIDLKKNEKSESFKANLKKLSDKNKRNQFFDNISKKFKPLDAILDSRTNMVARGKLMSGDFDDHPY